MTEFRKTEVKFRSKDLHCVGWLYEPNHEGKFPAIVMAHGFSAIKEQGLPFFAENFVKANMVVLLFDYRYSGESEGIPQGQIIVHQQLEDYKNAITFVSKQSKVNPEKIGVWGTSYSGGHVLHLAPFDRRIKVVVSQVMAIHLSEMVEMNKGRQILEALFDMCAKDRIQRFEDGKINYIPAVGKKGEFAFLDDDLGNHWFNNSGKDAKSPWQNLCSLQSLEDCLEYIPAKAIDKIHRPLLMIVCTRDQIIPCSQQKEAFQRASEPKKLIEFDGTHFEIYEEGHIRNSAAEAATNWFVEHFK